MNEKYFYNVILNGEFDGVKDGLKGFHAVRFCESESPEKASEISISKLLKQINENSFLNSINSISILVDEVIEIDSDNSEEGYNQSFIYYQEL